MIKPTRFAIPVLFVSAAAGPYLASETETGRSIVSSITGTLNGEGDGFFGGSSDQSSQPGSEATYANHSHYAVEKTRLQHADKFRYGKQMAQSLGAIPSEGDQIPRLVGPPINDLREILRFDINPDWVIGRFSRVGTVLGDMSLQGLRVPLVTGTKPDDLAGTLTYYFDKSGTLQRLMVHGFTGDPSRLVNTMTGHYGMQQNPSIEAGVYTKTWNARPIHFLRLTHAPVVYSDAVHHKYTVFLELNQPNLIYGISNEAQRIIGADRHTGRW